MSRFLESRHLLWQTSVEIDRFLS